MNKYELNLEENETELLTLDDLLEGMERHDLNVLEAANDDYYVVDTYMDELHAVLN